MHICITCDHISVTAIKCLACLEYYCKEHLTCCNDCDEFVCKDCTVNYPENPPICTNCYEKEKEAWERDCVNENQN